ncbi:MAG: hypothetical protein H6835_19265 [Planctomycetes bacterium]|nr:hypothetical protein [Planctomycetota bacterium]
MRFLTLLLPVAFLLPTVSAQKINDVILKKDGSRVRGLEIEEFLLSGVRGKRGSDSFEIPAHQVESVEWSDLPEAFIAGRAALERGDFQNATQLFGTVQSDRPLVKADAEFFQIKAAVAAIGNDKGAASTAAAHARTWLDANPNHWRTPEALLLTGRAQRLAGTAGTAAETLKELDDRAVRDGFGGIWGARAKFELALTLLADQKASEARTQFKSAASAAESALASADATDKAELAALQTQARVGEGETYLVDKDFNQAESFFRTLENAKDPALVAAGYAGEGEAIFLAAGATPEPTALRRAQLALAHASIRDIAGGEASAKANYYLGRVLLALGPDLEGDGYKKRAQGYFQIVYTAYPASRWASLARVESEK